MPLKTTMMVAKRFGTTLFAFCFQIYFFHPDDMFNHLLLELSLGVRNIFLKTQGDDDIRRFLDKLGFKVNFFFVYRLPEIFGRLDERFLLGI